MTFLGLAILILAAYRLTRFLVVDTLLDSSRLAVHEWLTVKHSNWLFTKVWELISCTWCSGIWISGALTSVYLWTCPLDFDHTQWILWAAVAGGQGLLHAWEPDDSV